MAGLVFWALAWLDTFYSSIMIIRNITSPSFYLSDGSVVRVIYMFSTTACSSIRSTYRRGSRWGDDQRPPKELQKHPTTVSVLDGAVNSRTILVMLNAVIHF